MSHEYLSSEYHAQEMVKCVRRQGDYAHIPGPGFYAQNHGNRVDLTIAGQSYELYFESGTNKVNARLEAVCNGNGEEIFKGHVNVERSSHGKISPKSYSNFFKNVILDAIKRYVLR